MKILILLSAVFLFTTCNSATTLNNVDAFWLWFTQNKEEFEQLNDENRDEKLDLLLTHLHTVDAALAVEVSTAKKGIQDLVISAEGAKEKFPIVRRIVGAAPTIPRWTITAFRQRSTDDFTLRYRSLKFDTSEMYFHPIVEDDSLDLIIYAKDIKSHNPDTVFLYGLITVDNILGEYDCVMKVRHYDFEELPDQKDSTFLLLKGLPNFVDS